MTLDLKKQKLMIDPPSGWMYGFPALWDKSIYPKLEDFLQHMKYPEKDIEFACQCCRMWNAEEK